MNGPAAPRFDLDLLVKLRVDGSRPHLCRALNLSETGMLVEVEDALDVGARVTIQLFLPGRNESVDLLGEVVRREELAYGIRFVELSKVQEAAIQFLLARRQASRRGSAA